MSEIKDWSTTAASNNSASPDGWPENMSPSGVNDSARENMSAVRKFYEAIEWRDFGHTYAYGSATTFTTDSGDGDTTSIYEAGRRVRAVGTSTGTIYGTIASSSHSGSTTVTVVWDSGSLVSESLVFTVGWATTGEDVGTEGQGLVTDGNGRRVWTSGARTLIEAQTASDDAIITFSTGIDSSFPRYVVETDEVTIQGDGVNLIARISQASTFKSDGNYQYHTSAPNSGSGTYIGLNGVNDTSFKLAGVMSGDASHHFSGEITLINPASTAMVPMLLWEGGYIDSASQQATVDGSGHYTGSNAAIDGIRFEVSDASNIELGEFRLYGVS